MKNFKNAFTMIELIFVIVILGILAGVAIPKFTSISENANIATKGKAVVSSIRTAIASERQRTLIKGSPNYPALLDNANNTVNQELFDGNATVNILQYPIYSSSESGGWMKITNNTGTADTLQYRFYINANEYVDFNYTKADGKFDCDHTNANCKELLN